MLSDGFRRCAAAVALAAALSASPALAHPAGTNGGSVRGIAIPGLTHGQMAVVADHRGEIEALADRQVPTDPTFRGLLNYARIQRTYCLWGLVPGSLADESSPFNECSHAYLSAFHALLDHMRTMPGARREVGELVDRIDAAMLREGASFVLCAFSAERFGTGTVHVPALRQLLRDPATLTLLGAIVLPPVVAGAARTRRFRAVRDA